ncbi:MULTISPECIES: DNA internalization-related competence protein ComEC/Rec2 [Lactiplantibacillus]|uniref:DNA internalization-related competence protein ComEC/Rec2 n=1 Tax=Lactiplantibacillus pentosus TaxID=1589 RepID=A0ABX5D005_LACPE|nr:MULTISPECIES: DNA internalization-related competence protein ComEC/Rec2 [Lactiplantibacillus]PRO94903.1 DNA internalization-related competence protein ComEC/Rec2 [Lactiplantibacillus pentosus]
MRPLFFAAISCGLLSSWLVSQQPIAAVLLGLWLFRVWCLRERHTLMVTLVCVVGFAGWFSWQNHRFEHLAALPSQSMQAELTVQPDAISIRGGQYQLVANGSVGRVLVRGQLKSAHDKQWLQRVTRRMVWHAQGTLAPIDPPTNPGQFDAPMYYRSQGIAQQLTLTQVFQIQAAPRTGWLGIVDRLHQWRWAFAQRCQQLPPMLARYASSLLVGLRPADFQSTMGAVQQLGLLHLFSLSGMHVILLISFLKWGLIRLHLSRQATDYWLLGLLPAYLILGGGADSLQRAVITAALPIVWELVTHRTSGALRGWSLALMIGLIHNPLVLSQLGGQLSYGLALLLILMPSMPSWKLAVWIQVISLPVLLVATAQWHALSLAVNLIVAPLFSWLLFPVTMIGAIFGTQVPGITSSCEWLLVNFQTWLDWVSHWPGLLVLGQPNAIWPWGLSLLSLWLLRTPTRRYRRLLVLAYGCFILSMRFPLHGAVQFIDVGQGDSILIRQPFNRQVSLIDTGGRLHFSKPHWQDDGLTPKARVETITVNYLHRLGITHLDTVYLSHKDVDHIGDLGELLRLMPVKRVVVPAGMAHLDKFQKLLQPAKQPPIVMEALAGQTFADGLTAVHPFRPGRAENEDSLVLTGVFGQRRFMFTGDLDRAGERAIAARYPQLRVDVLKLGHHGSKTASDPEALQQLGVRQGILSVGRHNRYGHPNQETLTTLANLRIETYSTALQGMITYRFFNHRQGQWQTFLKEGNRYQRTASVKNDSQR